LKPTNPVAQKAVLTNQYKVSPRPTARIKPKSFHNVLNGSKVSNTAVICKHSGVIVSMLSWIGENCGFRLGPWWVKTENYKTGIKHAALMCTSKKRLVGESKNNWYVYVQTSIIKLQTAF
jgi:hypothetical protein